VAKLNVNGKPDSMVIGPTFMRQAGALCVETQVRFKSTVCHVDSEQSSASVSLRRRIQQIGRIFILRKEWASGKKDGSLISYGMSHWHLKWIRRGRVWKL
jgi:hypothetical protein